MTELYGLQEQQEMKTTTDSLRFHYADDVRAGVFDKITACDDEGCCDFHLCAPYVLVAWLDVLISFYRHQVAVLAAKKRER